MIDLARLTTTLNDTKLQSSNNALYQFLKSLLQALTDLGKSVASITSASGPTNTDLKNRTYLTATDETALLPFSRELLAGTNVTFDDTTPGERTINVSGSSSSPNRSFGFVINGNGGTPTTGDQSVVFRAPCDGTIVRATLTGDATGSAVVDIKSCTFGSFPGSLASICASAKPTLSSARTSEDTTLTGWTTAISSGDMFICSLDSVSGETVLTVEIEFTPA